MKKIILLVAGLLLTTGCKDTFSGSLKVDEPIEVVTDFSLKKQKKLSKCLRNKPNSRKCRKLKRLKAAGTKVIDVGSLSAKVTPGSKKIKIELSKAGGSLDTIVVQVPNNIALPTVKGSVLIPAASSGFGYDLAGTLDTEVTYSDSQRAIESCSWTEPRKVCERKFVKIPNCEGPPRRCMKREVSCHTEYITYYGDQRVEFHHKYTDKHLDMDLLLANSDAAMANFQGDHHDSEKVYSFKGMCR